MANRPWPNVAVCIAMAGAIGAALSRTPGLFPAVAVAFLFFLLALRVSLPLVAATLLGVAAAISGLARGLVIPGLRPAELLILLAWFVSLALRPTGIYLRNRFNTVDGAFVAFVAVRLALEWYDSTTLGHPADYLTAATPITYWLAFDAARSVLRAGIPIDQGIFALVTPSVVPSTLGIAQVLSVPGINTILQQLTRSDAVAARLARGDLVRASATIGHWTSLGGYLLVVILAAAVVLKDASLKACHRRWIRLTLVLSLGAQLVTFTFAPIIATILMVLWVYKDSRALRRGAPWVAAGLGVFWLAIGSEITRRFLQQFDRGAGSQYAGDATWLPKSMSFRFQVWSEQFLPVINRRLWSGWGQNYFPPSITWPYYESSYIATAFANGLLGLVSLAVLLAAVFRSFTLVTAEARAWASLGRLLFVSLLVLMSVHPHLVDTGMPQILWPVTGMILGLRKVANAIQPTLGPVSGIRRPLESRG